MQQDSILIDDIKLNKDLFFSKCFEVLRHFMDYDTSFVTKEVYAKIVSMWGKPLDINDVMFLEKYMCLFFCYFDNFYSMPSGNDPEVLNNEIVYQKTVTMNPNIRLYMSDKLSDKVPTSVTVVYFFKDKPKFRDFTKYVGIPLIHSGTLRFFNTVRYSKQNTRYNSLLEKLRKIIGNDIQSSCLITVFASTSLANYGLYSEEDARPRDLDFWYLSERADLRKVLEEMESKDKDIDAYGLSVTKGKVSMTERYFNFFQSMANAGPKTKYIPTSLMGYPYNQLTPQKIQTDNIAGEGPFLIIRPEDLLFNPDNHIYYNGFKFLVLELEVFRKHLRFLDKGCPLNEQRTKAICRGKVIEKDVEDFKRILKLINSGHIIRPTSTYERFLGIDTALETPIHSFAIYTSVPTEQAYDLKTGLNAPIIKTLSNKIRRIIASVIRVGFINKVIPESVVPKDHVFRRTVVSDIYKRGIEVVPIDTYTRITDPLSEVVYTHQKVYRNVALGTLPKTPIKSIYGNLPSTWLWILTDKGSVDVILVTSGLELITKHLALAANTNMDIIVAGELRIQTNGDLIFNTLSGTYINKGPILETEISERFYELTRSIIYRNFSANSKNKVYYTKLVLIPEGKSPLLKEAELLCSGYALKNRVYLSAGSGPVTFTQEQFDNLEKKISGQKICDIKVALQSSRVDLVDFDTSLAMLVVHSEERFKSLVKVSDFNVADSLMLKKGLANGITFVDKCSLSGGYKNYIMLPKSSTSVSSTILAEVKLSKPISNYVALKIHPFSSDPSKDNSLEIEELAYSKFPLIIENYATPNLLMYISSFTCDINFFTKELGLRYILTVTNAKDPYYRSTDKIRILMTEWAVGMSLADFLTTHKDELTEDFLKSIIFQIVYTVAVLHRLGIQQNDLHLNNIWLTKLPYPTYYSFFVNPTQYFAVKVAYICRIFDFDRAIIKGINNTKLYTHGFPTNIRELDDIVRFICSLLIVLKGSKSEPILLHIVSQFADILKLIDNADYYCMPKNDKFDYILPPPAILTKLWQLRNIGDGFDTNYLQRGKDDFVEWFGNDIPYSNEYIGRMFAFNFGKKIESEEQFRREQKKLINEIKNNFLSLMKKGFTTNFYLPPLEL